MNHIKWYAILALLIISTYLVVIMQIDDTLTDEHETRVNEQQALQTQLGAQGIEAHFKWILGNLANLAVRGIPSNIDNADTPEQIEPALNELFTFFAHSAYPEENLALRYIDRNNDIIATYQQSDNVNTGNLALLSTWFDDYGTDVLSSETYHVTDITITDTHRIFGVLYPVSSSDGSGVIGILIAMLDFNTILEAYLLSVSSSPFGEIWLQDSASRVIYDHEPAEINRYVTDLAAPYPELQRVNQRMMTQDTGQDSYRYPSEIGGEEVRKLVAWSTAYLGNQRLTIALSAPDTDINADVDLYRRKMHLVGMLLAIGLIVGSGLFYTSRQRDLKQLVAQHTHELQQLNSELEQRVNQRTAELTQKNAQLSTILETMDDGVLLHQNDRVIYTNPAITRLLGYTGKEIREDAYLVFKLVRQHLDDLSFTKLQRAMAHALKHHNVLHQDVTLARKNGETVYARLSVAGVHAPDGSLIGTLEIIHDNSHAIILQQQRDHFITNASHELRRPLSNLKTRLYVLRQQPEDLPKHLEVLERATNDMTDLVRDLVDVAQFTRDVIQLNRQNITLQSTLDAFRALLEIVAARRDVTVTYDVTPDPLPLFGDYQRLSQAISNVMIHAINATPAEGTVSLTMCSESIDGEQWGIIRIVDQNTHIDKEDLQHIFNPFFRPSEGTMKSTGLGLTIAHLIINQHGGSIDAQDYPDGGTLFVMKIPLNNLSQNDLAPHKDQTT